VVHGAGRRYGPPIFQQGLCKATGATAELDDSLGRTEIAMLDQPIERGVLVESLAILATAETVVIVPGLLPGQDRAGYWGRWHTASML
jgi:hypothetical protein